MQFELSLINNAQLIKLHLHKMDKYYFNPPPSKNIETEITLELHSAHFSGNKSFYD